MCGIAGIWGAGRVDEVEAAVAAMVAAQRHRGPDEQRQVTLRLGPSALILGFDRLAILDPSPEASQPMHHAATGSWLVFNGEIYNFRALRSELEARGHAIRSSGDTEVLLTALVAWGIAALPKLRGMYAFAFYDGRTRRLTLGRDPFGVKPLLYGRVGGAFVFASELRAIRAASPSALTIDPEALHGYLAYGAVPEPATIARDVRVLPPGHVLVVEDGVACEAPSPVVDLASLAADDPPTTSRAESIEAVGMALGDSVAAHLVSDVPLGVLLSGGVDSTLLASLAARRCGAPHFLTVGFDHARFDEVETARATACRLGGRHHVVPLTAADVLGLLPDALAAMDQPTADGVNTYVITRAAAERGVKVLVSGLGADELFGGYTTFRKVPLLARRGRWLAPVGGALAALGVGNVPQWSKVAAAGRVTSLREAYLLQRALGPDVCADPRLGLPEDAWSALPGGASAAFRGVRDLEVAFYLRSQLLRDADVFSSANSVELRVPFLDREVLRQAWRIPAAHHVGPFGRRKALLKALLHAIEPAHPVRRAKMGFVFPWSEWLHGPLGERVAATLADREAHEALGIDPASGQALLGAFRRGDPRVAWAQLWSRFVLVEWHWRAELDRAPAASPLRASA